MATQNGTPGVDPDFNQFMKLPGDSIQAKVESAAKQNK
jgi:hypothetical protein